MFVKSSLPVPMLDAIPLMTYLEEHIPGLQICFMPEDDDNCDRLVITKDDGYIIEIGPEYITPDCMMVFVNSDDKNSYIYDTQQDSDVPYYGPKVLGYNIGMETESDGCMGMAIFDYAATREGVLHKITQLIKP